MKKLLAFALIFSLIAISNVTAQDMNIIVSDDTQTVFEVAFPEYTTGTQVINGESCVWFDMPGCRNVDVNGAPALPLLPKMFMVSNSGKPEVEVTIIESQEIDCQNKVVPSKGHVTRNIPWDSVAYTFGEVYSQNAWYPQELVSLSKPFIMRSVRGVGMTIAPLRYNPVSQKLQVVKKLHVRLSYDKTGSINLMSRDSSIRPTREFASLHKDIFANYRTNQRDLPAETGGVCIITHPDFKDAANALSAYRSSKGKAVTVKITSTAPTSAEVQGLINDGFNKDNCVFFVLVGDSAYMPTLKGLKENAPSDPCYVKNLAGGEDNVPDAFISRICANTNQEAQNQIDKIIAYEGIKLNGAANVAGTDYGGGSGEATKDFKRAEYLRTGVKDTSSETWATRVDMTAGGLEGKGYSYGDPLNDYCKNTFYPATTVSTSAMAEVFNTSGVALINYIGHGSETSWATSGFSVTNVNALKNENKYPIIFSVACVNGKYTRTSGDCFAEAWLKKANGGAAAVFAATTNMAWVPPCDAQIASNAALFAGTYETVGGIFLYGSVKCLDTWDSSNSSQGNMFYEQTHIFGDCSMVVTSPK